MHRPIPTPGAPEVEPPIIGENQARQARKLPCAGDERSAESFLFDDPYWDEAFDSYHNPTLRICCRC